MRLLIIPVLIWALFICGCGASSSGGRDTPASDYSGTYTVLVAKDAFGDLTILQNSSNAALNYRTYQYTVTESESGSTHTEQIALADVLSGTGLGKISGRKIDVTWDSEKFTRIEFTPDGNSFSAYGDASFAGVKQE